MRLKPARVKENEAVTSPIASPTDPSAAGPSRNVIVPVGGSFAVLAPATLMVVLPVNVTG
jgi:hypothetical protein